MQAERRVVAEVSVSSSFILLTNEILYLHYEYIGSLRGCGDICYEVLSPF